ncbi:MAG: response regulator [Magnetococcales bacterium]|nr:response regulator [Magnetococcales bacterium]
MLVIDDDPVIRELLAAILVDAGHVVRGAADGREGLDLFRAAPAEVVITDLLMPEVDGVAVIRELTEAHPDIRVIALSGGGRVLSADTSLHVAERLGAFRMLKKPFGTDEVLRAVADALGDAAS